MSEAVVAKRYAEALFQHAQEANKAEQLISELNVVKEVFSNDEQVVKFLNHPRVAFSEKKALIDKAFASFDQIIVNTIKLLVERHRIKQISAIIDEFIHFYNEANGIAQATVYSVRELTDSEKAELEETFKKKLNKQQVEIDNIVDPSIIGGVKIRIGNTIYDGSLSGKLYRIKQNLVSTNI